MTKVQTDGDSLEGSPGLQVRHACCPSSIGRKVRIDCEEPFLHPHVSPGLPRRLVSITGNSHGLILYREHLRIRVPIE